MKRKIKSILFFVILAIGITQQSDLYAGITDQELNIRDGLPNMLAKINQGDTIRVAYLGGSITAQRGWRVYSMEWLQKKYPDTVFEEINAAIGGTGSNFGVFRLNRQVLQYKPDLLFVEFAVNDDGGSENQVVRSMEGIVRQTWEANPNTDICFVYTIKQDFLAKEVMGILPASAQYMEKVAEKYGIPTINFGFEVADQVKENKLIFAYKDGISKDGIPVFSPDNVHPYEKSGHFVYKKVFIRSFEKIAKYNKKGKIKNHRMPKPIAKDYFSNTKMLDFSEVKLSNNWKILNVSEDARFQQFSGFVEEIAQADKTGESLTVDFTGRAIGIYDIIGPDSGRLLIEIDGIPMDTISRFDRWCSSRRMHYFIFDNLENKRHRVVFNVIADPFDKLGVMTLKKQDVIDNPEKYRENNWYVAKILLDGELTN